MLSTLYHLPPNTEDAGGNTAERDSLDSRCCPRVKDSPPAPPDLTCVVSNTAEWKGGSCGKAGYIRQTPSECG